MFFYLLVSFILNIKFFSFIIIKKFIFFFLNDLINFNKKIFTLYIIINVY